jgi:RimJ/RimL family protein N-acetyltransferase
VRFEPVTLRGPHASLAPLGGEHAADLLACADGSCFQFAWDEPAEWTVGGFAAYIQRAVQTPGRLAFAVLDGAGRAVGTTSYVDIQPAHRGVEIGFTWLVPAARGTRVNPAVKLLMLAHAFDDQGAVRVQLKCDARNVQSQRAIQKLGAEREGVLRKHRILPDGFVRDTVMYSVTREEWGGVRARLEERLRDAR